MYWHQVFDAVHLTLRIIFLSVMDKKNYIFLAISVWYYCFKDSGFHKNDLGTLESAPEDALDPPMLAETCMRELVGRASFGHIKAVLKPVFK